MRSLRLSVVPPGATTSFQALSGPGSSGPSLTSLSLAGVAGGREIRTSSSAGLFSPLDAGGYVAGFGGSVGSGASEFGILSNNEKWTMQNLNDRLAAYLGKVLSLEEANRELELKIHNFMKKSGPVIGKDFSSYYDNISLLQSQIHAATLENHGLTLQMDNAQLALEDFKLKYASCLTMRQGLERDTDQLRRARDELTLRNSNLEMEIEGLNEELIDLKNSHKGDQVNMSSNMSGEVNVTLDCGPNIDLQKVLAEMRDQYEAITAKNRSEAERMYQAKSEELKKEVAVHTETTQTSKSEVTELRSLLQALEIELQSTLSMKNSTEGILAETKAHYGSELEKLQGAINRLEAELAGVRSDMEHHAGEYQQLLGVKMRLEQEIATYRRLLEGEGISSLFSEKTEAAVSSTVSSSIKGGPAVSDRTDGSSNVKSSTKGGSTMSGSPTTSGTTSGGTVDGRSENSNTVNGSIMSGSIGNIKAVSGSTEITNAQSSNTATGRHGFSMNGSSEVESTISSSTMKLNFESSSTDSSGTVNGSINGGERKSNDTESKTNVISGSTSNSDVTMSSSTMNGNSVSGGSDNSNTKSNITLSGSTMNGSTMRGSTTSNSTTIGSAMSGSNGTKSAGFEYDDVESDGNESDGMDIGSPIDGDLGSGITRRASIRIRRVKTVIQDLIDGEVVATSVEEKEEPM
ncbi:keratin, type I cytoskeletal 19-like isoform X1 [Ambystoma mexicanum]|uniref:keratin, type I cytoskeletal 19-like isoform X1 n=1 Tax=Ambystoma mexicanum TaxID=8296 RepID=UPI0037E8F34C